jgi:hypothetical protein
MGNKPYQQRRISSYEKALEDVTKKGTSALPPFTDS